MVVLISMAMAWLMFVLAVKLALVLLILAMQSTRQTISKWNSRFPQYIMTKNSVPRGSMSVKQTINRAKKLFGPNALAFDEADGLKTIYEDSFIHIRPSRTEPIIRIFIEAPDKVTADQLLKETQAVLS